MQYSTAIRDAQANAVAAVTGPAPVLEIWAGPVPKDCAALDTGALLAVGTLPADWLTASAGGMVRSAKPWMLLGQIGAGMGREGDYYRIKQGGVCHVQGPYGKGQEMQPQSATIANGQAVSIDGFSITRGNA